MTDKNSAFIDNLMKNGRLPSRPYENKLFRRGASRRSRLGMPMIERAT